MPVLSIVSQLSEIVQFDKKFDSYDHSFDFASVSCFIVPAGHGG